MPRDPQLFSRGLISTPEAASNASKRGALLLINASGDIAECGAAPASITSIAAADGHNGLAEANSQLHFPIRAGDQFEVTLLETLAQGQIADTDVGFVKDATTGYWYASTADAGAQARIIDYVKGPGGWDIGDTKARVIVVFHTTKLQIT